MATPTRHEQGPYIVPDMGRTRIEVPGGASKSPEDHGVAAAPARRGVPSLRRASESPEDHGVATLREVAVVDNDATVRESGTHAGRGAVPPGSGSLPEELAGQLRLLRQIAGGGEATLFEVVETRSGEIRVLKLYHRHVTLRGEALRRIQTIDSSHVVGLTDFGRLTDGRWYEVQERIDTGNLTDYRWSEDFSVDDVADVVAQMAGAISAFHKAGLAHHDIKPENVLVRSASPLDLVLGDFGLSVVSDNSTYYATNRHATIAYQAPETMRQVGGGVRDYWALGLTIAMLSTGDAPYAGLNEHAILDQHYRRIPPPLIESMPKGRLKQLCRGLTRYDPKTRWSDSEVRRWLAGESPPLAPESPQQPSDPARAVRFNNERFSTPSALAHEIVGCWSLAAECIGVRSRREQFMDELILAFGTEPLARLTGRWAAEPPSRSSIDVAVVELVLALDNGAPATYGGRILTADSIAAAALGDSAADLRFIEDLRSRGILEAWSRHPENAELGAIDRRWREELRRADSIISDAAAGGAAAPLIQEWAGPLLAVCARRELLDDWKRQKDRPRHGRER